MAAFRTPFAALNRDRRSAIRTRGPTILTPLGAPPDHGELPPASPATQAIVEVAVRKTVDRFTDQKLTPEQIAVTLVDWRAPEKPTRGSFRGEAPIYPASVVKLFYLVAAHRWLEDGRLKDTPELRRALSDMIVRSFNEATHYVVDLITGTTSGPELPADALKAWFDQRNVVNRYFASLGYTGINNNQKPWCEGPYGRETQALRAFEPKRNWLTTDATARLLTEIATGQAVNARRSAEMMALLKRDPAAGTPDPEDQAKFTGPALPPGARLWSKAGWTSDTRHDAAYIELSDGGKFVLVTFTVDHAAERGILHSVAREVIAGLASRRSE